MDKRGASSTQPRAHARASQKVAVYESAFRGAVSCNLVLEIETPLPHHRCRSSVNSPEQPRQAPRLIHMLTGVSHKSHKRDVSARSLLIHRRQRIQEMRFRFPPG